MVELTTAAIASPDDDVVFTLPAGHRPATIFQNQCSFGDPVNNTIDQNPLCVSVNTLGQVAIHIKAGTINIGEYARINITIFIA